MKNVVFLVLSTLWVNAAFAEVNTDKSPVGSVILSFGYNTAQSGPNGPVRELKRKSPIYSKDILSTSEKGRLQIRFADDSRLALKPDTSFEITQYQFEPQSPNDGIAFYKLVKGGMRTLSGKIGKVEKEDYKLDTVVATIGIRGTDFSVQRQGDEVSGVVNSGQINVVSKDTGESINIDAGRGFSLLRKGMIQEREVQDVFSDEFAESSTSNQDSQGRKNIGKGLAKSQHKGLGSSANNRAIVNLNTTLNTHGNGVSRQPSVSIQLNRSGVSARQQTTTSVINNANASSRGGSLGVNAGNGVNSGNRTSNGGASNGASNQAGNANN